MYYHIFNAEEGYLGKFTELEFKALKESGEDHVMPENYDGSYPELICEEPE